MGTRTLGLLKVGFVVLLLVAAVSASAVPYGPMKLPPPSVAITVPYGPMPLPPPSVAVVVPYGPMKLPPPSIS